MPRRNPPPLTQEQARELVAAYAVASGEDTQAINAPKPKSWRPATLDARFSRLEEAKELLGLMWWQQPWDSVRRDWRYAGLTKRKWMAERKKRGIEK